MNHNVYSIEGSGMEVSGGGTCAIKGCRCMTAV